MKRIMITISACLLLAASATAESVSDFNMYAEIFGASEISNGIQSAVEDQDVLDFTSDGCRIVFASENDKLNSIIILGSGDKFLAYCAAAIMRFDPDSSNMTVNFGRLLASYLLCQGSSSDEERTEFTKAGQIISVKREGDQYRFIILAVK